MKKRATRYLLLVALVVGGGALAANKEIRCKKDCESIGKQCTEMCKQQIRKSKAPQTEQYCAPKCNEIKTGCDKECENAQNKHKKR